MRYRKSYIVVSLFLFVFSLSGLYAQENAPFGAEISADNINVRTDSTVASEVICAVGKGERVEVVAERYDWYKIRLPKKAHLFIKKSLVIVAKDDAAPPLGQQKETLGPETKSAKVAADRVNIRLSPAETSAILGKAKKDEAITIVSEKGDWYKIEPTANTFGWVNKKFAVKVELVKKPEEALKPDALQKASSENIRILEGTIKPYGMIIKRPATHRLIVNDGAAFLLKGNKKDLDAFNHHKAKVTGKLITPTDAKLPVIEVEKIENIN